MLKWITNMVGGGKPAHPDAIDAIDATAPWLEKLERILAKRTEETRYAWPAGFVSRLVEHVATGGAMSVLTESAPLGWMASEYGQHHSDLYGDFDQIAPEVALRWAKVLATAWQSASGAFQLALPNGSHWAESLMLHAARESPSSYRYGNQPPRAPYRASHLESLLVADGLAPESLLVAAFAGSAGASMWSGRGFMLIARAPDYPEAVDRHLESLRGAFAGPEVNHRLHVIKMLERVPASTLQRLGAELADFTVSNSKQVRQGVHALADQAGATLVEALRRFALEGTPEQRQHALRRLDELARDLADDSLAAFARETAAADKAASVRALLLEWSHHAAPDAGSPQADMPARPVVDWSADANPVSEATQALLWRAVDAEIEKANHQAREHHASMVKTGRPHELFEHAPFPPGEHAALRDWLASSDRPAARPRDEAQRTRRFVVAGLSHLAVDLTPAAAIRLLTFFDLLLERDTELGHWACRVFNGMRDRHARPTLLEVASALEDAGVAPGAVMHSYCRTWGRGLAADWPADAVATFFARHVDVVEQFLLRPPANDYFFDRAKVFRAVATLPRPPASLVNALFGLALGTSKTDRALAQDALAAHPGKEARIVAALADGKADTRTVAAQWLGRLRHAPALDALEKACAKEKNDVAKGALLDALQSLGQSVEKYLDRDALAKEAPKALAKGMPKELEAFPWSALPAVRWSDNGEAVPPDVLRWLVVQAVKQKSPEPNAVLRKLCAMMEPRDREAFGQFVLETWLREDVKPISPEEAFSQAGGQAQQMIASMSRYPQHYQGNPHVGKTIEDLLAFYLPTFQRMPAGSAIGIKGALAVAAACAGERAAGPTQRYLKEWYGTRAAQGKALIAMLAWIEHPGATQLMLSIGSRFRTKSFQEEATRQAQALAERKGWTLAELADRTIPSAGFDEAGTMELSYGARLFMARLLPDFKVDLFNPDGKKIAALPEPRQDDDADAAKDSKKAFSAAKKELRSIADLQADRLHEALCTQRDWPAADWLAFLFRHPVMRHLVQRLVWNEVGADGAVLQSFRPLDDGTLTNLDDEEVTLRDDARVRLAHDSNLPADTARAWRQHLTDYAIQPLFPQFGKGGYALAADRANATELKDFEGHLLEAFALRGRALKLGWTRGPAEDGGWFHVYEKRFPTLGLQATIEFTGNPLPETNRTVALVSLAFQHTTAGAAGAARTMALSTVPAVLLSECHDDLRLIAAEGTGFDADWQKKSEYR